MKTDHVKPTFFRDQQAAFNWMNKFHASKTELWVGFHKVHLKKTTPGYKDMLDVALCYGWIDGIRKSIDDDSYMIRFTPRKPKSIWSSVNIKRMEELLKLKLVHASGKKTYTERDPEKQDLYSFENKHITLSPEFEAIFRKNRKAWKWYSDSPAYYKRTAAFLVMSAKQEETRKRRLMQLISDSESGRKIKQLTYTKAK